MGIGTNVSGITFSLCNSQKSIMSPEEVVELKNLLDVVSPLLNDSSSFKIILLLLLTESEFSPSFKRLHTAFASAILRNSSGTDRGEKEILGPYFTAIQRKYTIYTQIQVGAVYWDRT